MKITLQAYHLPALQAKARLYQDSYLAPLWSTVARYVDRGFADENWTVIKRHVASVLAPGS